MKAVVFLLLCFGLASISGGPLIEIMSAGAERDIPSGTLFNAGREDAGAFAAAINEELTSVSDMSSADGSISIHNMLSALMRGETLDEVIKDMDSLDVIDRGHMPDWFETEVMDADEIEEAFGNADVFSDSDGSVIGFTSEKAREVIRQTLVGTLCRHGWLDCGSGEEDVLSLYKGKGKTRWMMIQFADIGDMTSVVLHIERS